MAGMPPLPRPALLRALLVAALAVLASAAWSPAAQAGVTVTIVPPGGGPGETISTDDIANGEMRLTYSVRRADGGIDRIDVAGGVSIRQLLARTGTDAGYVAIEIPRPGGGNLRLTEDDVISHFPPGFYTDAQGVTRFIGATEDGAVAADDHFAVGATLVLTQKSPSKLSVRVSPREKTVDAGESFELSARAKGAEAGDAYTYKWHLRGKKEVLGTRKTLSHELDADGSYRIVVDVGIEGSDQTVSDYADVQVGDPKDSEGPDGVPNDTDGTDPLGGSTASPGFTPPAPVTPATPTPSPVPPAPTPDPTDPPGIVTDGTTVEGNLLADVGNPPSSSILDSARRAARDGAPRDDQADGAGVSEAALGIAGLLGLLALGAGIELRQGPPRRATRSVG
jgi:hypothetical protein